MQMGGADVEVVVVASEFRDGWATFPGLCSCLSSCGSVYPQRLLKEWGGGSQPEW